MRLMLSVFRRAMSSAPQYGFKTVKVDFPRKWVAHVELNRAAKKNAFNTTMWLEFRQAFEQLGDDQDCRAVVVSGDGDILTAGIDFKDFAGFFQQTEGLDASRKGRFLRNVIESYQATFTSMEKCMKPVIVACHGAVIGAGVDLMTAADIRYASEDAWFTVKEVDLGLAADVGTLQRLHRVIKSDSAAREMVYTASKVSSQEALDLGLVSRVFPDKAALLNAALHTAELIASKSPVAVQTSKRSLLFSRDHTVEDSLRHMADLNQLHLQSEDTINATMSAMANQTPEFSKL